MKYNLWKSTCTNETYEMPPLTGFLVLAVGNLLGLLKNKS